MLLCSPLPTVRLAFYSILPKDCENDKPPIIFLHGGLASKESWNDIPQNVANLTKRKVSEKLIINNISYCNFSVLVTALISDKIEVSDTLSSNFFLMISNSDFFPNLAMCQRATVNYSLLKISLIATYFFIYIMYL